jgi:GNAT superfamily N-acetyltransferase
VTLPHQRRDTRPVRARLQAASAEDGAALAPIFARNLAYFRSAGEVADDADSVPDSVVRGYLDKELARPRGRCLVVRDATSAPVGTVSTLVPHPREPYPWIGLLLIHGSHHGEGLGTAAAEAAEQMLADEGWTEVRIGVLDNNPSALAFRTRLGYVRYDRKTDTEGRRCTLFGKRLSRRSGPR